MRYHKLGKTGLDVSVLAFGGSSLGGAFHEIDELEGRPVLLDDRGVPSGEEIAAELERYLRGQ